MHGYCISTELHGGIPVVRNNCLIHSHACLTHLLSSYYHDDLLATVKRSVGLVVEQLADCDNIAGVELGHCQLIGTCSVAGT